MSILYLVGRRNTGAALFNNSQKVPYLFRLYKDASAFLESQLPKDMNSRERENWFIKKFECNEFNAQNIAFAVFSQRLGRGNYKSAPYMVKVFASKSEADRYKNSHTPRSILGKFFGEYELSVGQCKVK